MPLRIDNERQETTRKLQIAPWILASQDTRLSVLVTDLSHGGRPYPEHPPLRSLQIRTLTHDIERSRSKTPGARLFPSTRLRVGTSLAKEVELSGR